MRSPFTATIWSNTLLQPCANSRSSRSAARRPLCRSPVSRPPSRAAVARRRSTRCTTWSSPLNSTSAVRIPRLRSVCQHGLTPSTRRGRHDAAQPCSAVQVGGSEREVRIATSTPSAICAGLTMLCVGLVSPPSRATCRAFSWRARSSTRSRSRLHRLPALRSSCARARLRKFRDRCSRVRRPARTTPQVLSDELTVQAHAAVPEPFSFNGTPSFNSSTSSSEVSAPLSRTPSPSPSKGLRISPPQRKSSLRKSPGSLASSLGAQVFHRTTHSTLCVQH